MDKYAPRSLDAEGLTDGQYVIDVVDEKVTGWVPVPATGVESVGAGTYIEVDDTDPLNPIVTAMVPLTTLNSSGLPEIVFDSDGHLIYTEAP